MIIIIIIIIYEGDGLRFSIPACYSWEITLNGNQDWNAEQRGEAYVASDENCR
jgi:hypothetical protein